MPKTFTCRVITPEGLKLQEQATSVKFPASDGLVGVLADHAPMMSIVGTGSLAVVARDGRKLFLPMEGGFVEIRDNVLTILAEQVGELLERSDEGPEKTLAEAKRDLDEQPEETG